VAIHSLIHIKVLNMIRNIKGNKAKSTVTITLSDIEAAWIANIAIRAAMDSKKKACSDSQRLVWEETIKDYSELESFVRHYKA